MFKLKQRSGLPFRFVPKIWAVSVFSLLLIGSFVLFSARKKDSFRFEFLKMIYPDFHLHISNFTIGYLLYAGIGFMWLMMGVKLRPIILLGLGFLIINFVYEWWIPVLNTPDPVDAYFGFAGIALASIFLSLTAAFGLRKNPLFVPEEETERSH